MTAAGRDPGRERCPTPPRVRRRPKGGGFTNLHLDPYLLRIGTFGVRWYGFFMAVSMACGIHFLLRRGRAVGVDEDAVYNLALVCILGGVIGAREVFVLTNWSAFQHDPAAILRIYQGGLSIHGALIGGLALGLWYAARARLPFWALADGMVPGACIGIFLVRIGNIFNGEILGRTAVILGGHRHPAQAYEMLFALILWFIYWAQARRNVADGVAFWSFIFWYGILRFISELFRANPLYIVHYVNPYFGFGVTTLTQLFTPLILILAILALRWRRSLGLHSADVAADVGNAGPLTLRAPSGGEPRA